MKKSTLFIICFTLFSGLLVSQASAQTAGWDYFSPVMVHENSGTTQTNIQVPVRVNTQDLISAGKMDSTGKDIRFFDDCAGTTEYSYLLQDYLNTDTTLIWVLVPSLNASDSLQIYMFYGNDTASAVSSIDIFEGPYSSTDSVIPSSTNNVVSNSSRGFIFSAQREVLIGSFGKREPTGTTRYVTLWDVATQTIIVQDTVPGASGSYFYKGLETPLFIYPGRNYILTLFQGQGDGYYFGVTQQIGQHLTYGGSMRYCNNCTENTFPSSTLTNYHYGVPDFWYYLRNIASVDPSAVVGDTLRVLNVSPMASATSGCIGDTITLNGMINGGMASYASTWSPGAQVADSSAINTTTILSGAATFTFNVTDAVGCTASGSVSLTATAPSVDSSAVTNETCQGDGSGAVMITASGSGNLSYMWSNSDTSAMTSNLTNGVYTVTVTDGNGCTTTDSFTVAFTNANPTPGLGADTTICEGSTLTLDAGSFTSYLWSDQSTGQTLTVSTAGTYSVAVTDANGCSGNDSIAVAVAAPQVNLGPDTVLCAGDMIMLRAPMGQASYSWSTGATTPAIQVTMPGTYVVTITDQFGCTATDSILIDNCVSIEPGSGLNGVATEIYPNPFTTGTTVRLSLETSMALGFQVTDMQGRVVLDIPVQQLNAGVQSFKIMEGDHTGGVYFLRVYGEQGAEIHKLLLME